MAQTAGVLNATAWALYVAGTKVSHGTSASIEISMETRDTTSKDSSGWAEKLEGLRSWSGSFDGNFAEDASYGESDIFTLINTRATGVVKFSTEVAGNSHFTGTAYVVSLSKTGGVEDNTTWSFGIEGTSTLTRATTT